MMDDRQNLSGSPLTFVAFPFHETPESMYYSGIVMSFSVLADKTNFFGNDQVNYAAAKVEMKDDAGSPLAVTIVGSDNQIVGLSNSLRFTANASNNNRYTVTVKNVRVNGVVREYTYWFTVKTGM